MRQGKQAGGRAINPPYGLGDPAAADVVRRIYQEFTDPYRRPSLAELAHDLNVDQVVTARGGQWYASTVRYVVMNPIYIDAGIISSDTWQAAQRRLRQLRPGPPV